MWLICMGEEQSTHVSMRKAIMLLCCLVVLGIQFTTFLFMDPCIGSSGSADYTSVCLWFLRGKETAVLSTKTWASKHWQNHRILGSVQLIFFSCYPFLLHWSAYWARDGLISLRYNQKQKNSPYIKKLRSMQKQRQRGEIVQPDNVRTLTLVSLV